MLEIGLTGGIGSGKTSVATRLGDYGAVVLDADAIMRELQEPGQPAFLAMVDEFGPSILDADGRIDRPKVAAIVFHDPAALGRLNSAVHPLLFAELTRRRHALAATDATVVLDLPLLVESGHRFFAGIVVVDVAPELAIERLVTYRGFSRADAEARVANQTSRAARLEVADFVIDNNGPPDALPAQVQRCWDWIMSLPRPEPGDPVVSMFTSGESTGR